jgi:hypothetical protein
MLGIFLTAFFKILEDLKYFSLLRTALTTHKISNLKAEQIRRRRPTCFG